MLSVDDCKDELNAPFDEADAERPARCYSRRQAEALRRQAYRFFSPLARQDDPTDDRTEQTQPSA